MTNDYGVDGSCKVSSMDRNFMPWTEVISHGTPPHLVKVKNKFYDAQIYVTGQI